MLNINKSIYRIFVSDGAALILFIASAFLGMWFAYDSSLSWLMLITLLVSIGLFLAISNLIVSPRQASKGIVIAAGLVTIYFVSQYAHFDYQSEVGIMPSLGRITGAFMPRLVFFTPHPNAIASFLEGAFLLSVVLIFQQRVISKRLIFGGITLLITYGLALTGSRGAWTGLAVATGLWVLLHFSNRRSRLVSASFGLIIGLVLSGYLIFPNLYTSLSPNSLVNTADSRFTLYQNSLNLWRDYPFTGIGLGDTFAMVYSRYQLLISVPFLYHAHNIFLAVGLGQGMLGLVALGWLLIVFYRFVIRVERIGTLNAEALPVFRAAWLGVTVHLMHGLTDSAQFSVDRWTMLMPFALAGLTMAIGYLALPKTNLAKNSGTDKAYTWQIFWLGGIIVVFIIAGIVFRRPLASAWYSNIGAIYQTRADLSPNLNGADREVALAQAAKYFERTLRLNPMHPVTNRRLGMIALDQQDFESAIFYLERAYTEEPQNQATLKALGYAYLWSGQLDIAQEFFQQVDFQDRLVQELRYLEKWWRKQDQQNLASYAGEMLQRYSATEKD